MNARNESKTITIVGGGLVGALNACYFAKRGYKVDLYELRKDIRKDEFKRGRSINLALSCRGREALKVIGMEQEVISNGIPMYARMIHDLDGTRRPIPYGNKDQYIMSTDRARLNELLLDAAEKYPTVTTHFETKLTGCNLDEGECTFQIPDGTTLNTKADLVLGNDGAFSAVRRQMMKEMRFNFQQHYIDHGYMELRIPPTDDGKFAMEVNYLHIWARNTYMMIALPNTQDNSFVLTLFMPFDYFGQLKTEKDVLDFFKDKFPDSVQLIGEKELVETVLKSKPLPLVSIKCNPYHKSDKVLLMGDAAHAMVPFYGQGMNCGFEDCLVLYNLLNDYQDNLEKVLPEYTKFRNPDAEAMCDLALNNYIEMRASVNSRLFLFRKMLDNFLFWLFPKTWIPLYTMVSFTRTRYHQCIAKRAWQDKILSRVLAATGVAVVGVAIAWSVEMKNSQYLHGIDFAGILNDLTS